MFNEAISQWRARTESYIYYNPPDGADPNFPPYYTYNPYNTKAKLYCYWLARTSPCTYTSTYTMVNGQCQETCRDQGHVGLGLANLFLTAETAYIQGIDLWTEYKDRFAATLEYNMRWINGEAFPAGFCDGNDPPRQIAPTWEIAYNALKTRLGIPLPNTLQGINRQRGYSTGEGRCAQSTCWETMTHAEIGL
jgi:hypothetical protein